MADFPGVIPPVTPSLISTTVHPAFLGTLVPPPESNELIVADSTRVGVVSITTVQYIKVLNRKGAPHADYSTIFYDRLSVDPLILSFGVLAESVTLNVTLSNSSLSLTRVVTDAILPQTTGLFISGVTFPLTLLPTQSIVIGVTATTDGPVTLSGNIRFVVTGEDELLVAIQGVRSLLYPLEYSIPTRENLKWLNEVLVSNSGSEQRRRLRISPRQRFRTRSLALSGERAKIDNLIFSWRDKLWSFPVWTEARKLNAPVVADSRNILADTLYGDFRIGTSALLFSSRSVSRIVIIQGITSTSITTVEDIPIAFPVSSFLIPLRTCRIVSDPGRTVTGSTSVITAEFEATDNTVITSEDPLLYKGEEYYTGSQLKTSRAGNRSSYTKRVDVVDYATGGTTIFSPWDNLKITKTYRVLLEGLQEVWEFRQWIHRRAGRLVPVWIPTFEPDFDIQHTGPLGTTFRVRSQSYEPHGRPRKDVAIQSKDGTFYFREIISADRDTITDEDILQLDSAVPIDAEDVYIMMYFGLHRLSRDDVTINWVGNNVATADVPVTEVIP